jgi:hypothetical protein
MASSCSCRSSATFRSYGLTEMSWLRSSRGALHLQLRERGRSVTASAARTGGWVPTSQVWGIDADERHRYTLAAGDLVLVYVGAPERTFIGRAELASPAHDWTSSEAQVYPGDSPGGVSLARVEEWDPPVPMSAVLPLIDPSEGARADFEAGVVRITAHEYETARAVAAIRATSTR